MTEKKKRATASTVLAVVVGFLVAYRDVLLDALGAVLIVAGIALWSVPVALIAAGVAVLLIVHPIPVRRS